MFLTLALACAPSPTGHAVSSGGPIDGAEDTGVSGDPTITPFGGDPTPGARVPPDVDVLVVGAGPAGLAAALDAQEAGARVQVLEREDDFGGSANWAGGLMLFSGTPEQLAGGVSDSPATLLAEWPSFTGGDATDPWVVAFAEGNVPLVYTWLAGFGVTWLGPTTDMSSGSTPRVHAVAGGGRALVGAIEAPLDGGTIRYDAEARALVRDRSGRVIGVRWHDLSSDEDHLTRAGAVIVATGGFMHDLERVRAERTDLVDVDLRYGSWPGADGNGLALLEAEGAATQNLGAVGIYAHGVSAPGNEQQELLFNLIGWVPWINALGERFVDESSSNSFQAGATRAAQPGGGVWAVFDTHVGDAARFAAEEPGAIGSSLAELAEAGVLVSGEDVGDVADQLALDSDTVTSQILAYNAYALGESETDTFRTSHDAMAAVLDPPIFALPVATALAKGFGGIDVDLSGRVLDTSGAVIPGLYAAGELTGMAGGSLVGDYGFTGSLSAVVLGGRVAGQAAAAEALAERL